MICHTVFALIANNEVQNIVVGEYTPCNEAARESYGQDAFAVEVTQIPVEIEDLYDGGFYRMVGGERVNIESVPTQAQEIAELKAQLAAMREELDVTSLSVLDIIGMEV